MESDRQFCFTPELYQPKITHRPGRPQSQVTRDTFEESFRRDQIDLDRRCARYRANASKQYHHFRPLERGNTFWDDWKIVDRGKGRPETNECSSEVQPIRRKKFVPIPDHNEVQDIIQSPWNDKSIHMKDPIISRSSSVVHYSETSPIRNGCSQHGTFDPIKSQWIVEPENEHRRDNIGFLKFQSRLPSSHGIKNEHPYIHKDEDPITTFKPSKKKISLPRDQGLYDPIKNAWLLLPENKRICEGEAFSPVSKLAFR